MNRECKQATGSGLARLGWLLIMLAAMPCRADEIGARDPVLSAAAIADWSAIRHQSVSGREATTRALAEAALAAAKLDEASARRAVRRALGSHRATPPQRAYAWSLLAGVAFARNRYDRCVEYAERWLQALPAADPAEKEARQMMNIARMLATLPSQERMPSTPHTITMTRDESGLWRAPLTVDGKALNAVVDTGANLSVLSASAAAALGLAIRGAASVRGATEEAVPVRVAVAPELAMAGARFRNVAFLVMDDSALSFPNGYSIPAIVGFPVLRALDEITVQADGEFSWRQSSVSRDVTSRLFADGANLYVEAGVLGRRVSLHLDSGAASSALSDQFAVRHPALLNGKATQSSTTAGAGGAREGLAVRLESVPLAFGSTTACLSSLVVDLPGDAGPQAHNLGRVGMDVLQQFAAYTIDFRKMTLRLHPQVPRASRVRCG